jgi:putative redox protein
MKSKIEWNGKMKFAGGPEGFSVPLDSTPPLGEDTGMSPKQMMLVSICGCTGMDVVALLKKYKQPLVTMSIEAEADTTDDHPRIFKEVHVRYVATGEVEIERLKTAVDLSMNQYCGVSAIVAKACPIRFSVVLNGKTVHTGQAFPSLSPPILSPKT